MNILFICTANTCRSPIAQGIMEKLLQHSKKEHTVMSAGLYAHNDAEISDMAKMQLDKRGIDFNGRKSVRLNKQLIDKADLIFSMTDSQRRMLIQNFPDAAERIHLLGDYTNRGGDVVDPYGMDVKAYNKCASDIEDMLKILVDMI